MIRSAADADGVFLERAQTRRGLARTDDSGRAVRTRRLDQRRRCGRNAREAAEQVERNPLGGQDRLRRTIEPDGRFPGGDPAPVGPLDHDFDHRIEQPECE